MVALPIVLAAWVAAVGGSLEPREAEAAVSRDHTTVLQPGQWSESLFHKKKKEEEEKKKKTGYTNSSK